MLDTEQQPVPAKRTRTSKPKVKTGCGTCKIRHSKCDETKPICLRCSTAGLICDGYRIPSGLHTGLIVGGSNNNNRTHSILAHSKKPVSTSPSPLVNTPTIISFKDEHDFQAFTAFQTVTIRQFTDALKSDTWPTTFLQLSHLHAPIRHALSALGALSSRFQINAVLTTTDSQANKIHNVALTHYHASLRELRHSLQNPPSKTKTSESQTSDLTHDRSELALLTSLLFIVIEFFQGNDQTALLHLRSAFAIIRQNRNSRNEHKGAFSLFGATGGGQDVEQLFFMLDMFISAWLDLPTCHAAAQTQTQALTYDALWTADFRGWEMQSVVGAGEALVKLTGQVYTFAKITAASASLASRPEDTQAVISADLLTQHTELQRRCTLWHTNFQKLTTTLNPAAASLPSHHLTVMLLNFTVTRHTLLTSLLPFPLKKTFYATLTPQFQHLLTLARTTLFPVNILIEPRFLYYYCPAPPVLKGAQPLLGFFSGVIPPLYHTAVCCTDAGVREEALGLMEGRPWREGAWDSCVMARIARRKVREAGSSGGA